MKLLYILFLTVIIIISFSSCENFSYLFQLQKKILTEYNEKVNIRLTNNMHLDISLVNSELNDLGIIDRKEASDELTIFAIHNYGDIDNIVTISINYIIYKNYIIYRYTILVDNYEYKKENNEWISIGSND